MGHGVYRGRRVYRVYSGVLMVVKEVVEEEEICPKSEIRWFLDATLLDFDSDQPTE